MSDDLVTHLRAMARDVVCDLRWCDEAADEIERLRADAERRLVAGKEHDVSHANRKMFEVYAPVDDGHATVHVRWMMETPDGWVGSWDKNALLLLLKRHRANEQQVAKWAAMNPRPAAAVAFLEGPEREAAYWVEWAEARMKDET